MKGQSNLHNNKKDCACSFLHKNLSHGSILQIAMFNSTPHVSNLIVFSFYNLKANDKIHSGQDYV